MFPKDSEVEKGTKPGSGIMSKPLPQVLDEMDDNIRKAQEAAVAAKFAADQAHQYADQAGGAAEEAATAAVAETKKALLAKIDDLEKKIAGLVKDANARVDKLAGVVRDGNQAKTEVYNDPKAGLSSV